MTTPTSSVSSSGASGQPDAAFLRTRRKGRINMLLIMGMCALPVVASYLTYYVIKPGGRTNYGTLIDSKIFPMPDAAQLGLKTLDGKPASLADFAGKWVMLSVDNASACDKACEYKLFEMRQLRTMQGKERERIERVWLVTDQAAPSARLDSNYAGTVMLRGSGEALKSWLPVDNGATGNSQSGSQADNQGVASDTMDKHIYLIDPLGHLMMRFPENGDPAKMKTDIKKLLAASSIG